MTVSKDKVSRAEYFRAYREANKERLNAAHRERRSDTTRANEERRREKKRMLKEIEALPYGPWWSREC